MTSILDRILAYKTEEVAARKVARPLAAVTEAARAAPAPRGFARALKEAAVTGYGLIAEIKKASPSKGLIRADFDPPALARAYEAGGATCLSVLTDGPSFQGDDAFLTAAHDAVKLPCLRKDFLFDPWQVVEARALRADCILIIMAMLSDAQAAELEAAAAELGMDTLIEVHDRAELDRAARLKSRLVGINNRNLNTFALTLDTTRQLARLVPEDRLIVCESGLSTPSDLAEMARFGARCFLIGESLMRQDDVAAATRALLANPRVAQQGHVMAPLTHFDAKGDAHMVDVSAKPATARTAVAEGVVIMTAPTLALVATGQAAKGDVLGVARLAGIMAAKRTAELIPLCHPLALTRVAVDLMPDPALPGVRITATVATTGPTGVEMEALTAVSIAALTVYDMLKAVERSMAITGIRLVMKDGGASGRFEAAP